MISPATSKDAEQALRNLSEQMLLGVAAKYGKDSGEYGKAGGVPKSEYRRSMRKKPELATESPQTVASKPMNGEGFQSMNEPKAMNGNGNGKVLVS